MEFGHSVPSYPPNWLSANYYHNIPHNEVNWAALAQQWIAMRQTGEEEPREEVVPQQPPLPTTQPPPVPPTEAPVFPPNASDFTYHTNINNDVQPDLQKGSFPLQQGAAQFWPPEGTHAYQPKGPLRSSGPLLATPPIPPLPVGFMERAQLNNEGFHPPSAVQVASQWRPRQPMYRHPGHNLPTAISLREPMSASSETFFNESDDWYSNESPNQFFPTSSAPPAGYGPPTGFPTQDMDYRKWKPPFYNQKTWMVDDRSSSNSPDYPVLDQQQRKFLPAWIREGLEKMEREKFKKQQEEEQKAATEKQKQEEREQEGKSRFESDSDSDEEDPVKQVDEPREKEVPKSPAPRRTSRFSRSPVSEEEYKEKVLGLLRKWMTEILLEVTDSEITNVVNDVQTKHLRKAQPKMLAQSTALAAITSFGDAGSEESSGGEQSGEEASGDEERDKNESDSKGFKMPLHPPVSIVRPVSKQRTHSKSNSDVSSDIQISRNGDSNADVQSDVSTDQSEGRKREKTEVSTSRSSKEAEKSSRSKSTRHKSNRSRSRSRSRDRERKRTRREGTRSRSRSKERSSSSRSNKHKKRSRSRSRERRDRKRSRKDKD